MMATNKLFFPLWRARNGRQKKSVYDKKNSLEFESATTGVKRVFIERNGVRKREKRNKKKGGGRSSRGNNTAPVGGDGGDECIFFGEITAVFQQLSEPFLQARQMASLITHCRWNCAFCIRYTNGRRSETQPRGATWESRNYFPRELMAPAAFCREG